MNLLERYLLQQFTKHLLLVLCSLLAIYLLVDFFERIDNFMAAGQSALLAGRYLLLKIPLMCEQLLPVCILLGGVLTIGLLNHNRELPALKAGGICITAIIRPLVIGALIITLFSMANSQWLLPKTMEACNTIWFQQVKKKVPKGIVRKGRSFYRGDRGIYSFIRPSQTENRFMSFSYTAWDAFDDLNMLLTADEAIYSKNTWIFKNGQIKDRNSDGDFQIRVFDETSLALPDSPENFFVPPYKATEFSISELYNDSQSSHGISARIALVNLHQKLSYIFLGIPLLLLGIQALLFVHQKWSRDLSLAIPLSCGLAFAAWGWWSGSQALATAGYVHPAISAWLMHVIAIAVSTIYLQRQNR